MKKFFSYIFIITVLFGLFAPLTAVVNAQTEPPATPGTRAGSIAATTECDNWILPCTSNIVGYALSTISYAILKFMSWGLWIAGTLLNFILEFTIVNMKKGLDGMSGINIAWKVIRDLMNIAFIFMLVYEGIKLIIGQGSTTHIKKFITGIVLASILINFSLFFTKVLIDASNIVTIGFYNVILGPQGVGDTGGLSNRFVHNLGIATIYSEDAPPDLFGNAKDVGQILIATTGAGLIILVTAFVFFAVSIMFIVRYLVLIVLLMLSPIGYMGIALPVIQPYAKQWWDALRGQLLFAPVYMILTWITLILIGSPGFVALREGVDFAGLLSTGYLPPTGTTGGSYIGLILNFALIIGLLVMTLIISKGISTRGNQLIGQFTKSFTAGASTALIGGSAWAGRKGFGSFGNRIASSANLQEAATKERSGYWDRAKGMAARTTLYGSRTARDATFDARNATLPTAALGDAIEGTLGRTRVGKWAGFDDLNWKNVGSAESISSIAGTGRGGTKGYAAEQKEKGDRLRKESAANQAELSQAVAERNIVNGQNADKEKDPEKYEAIEKSITESSAKQIEAILAGNRELLKSQNFANMISVKQLEAINKSDQFSDEEKSTLNAKRFSVIQDAKLVSDEEYKKAKEKEDKGTATQIDKDLIAGFDKRIKAANGRIKGLADSEIELLTREQLADSDIVSQFRSAQFESIAKNSQFTSTQKKQVKDIRLAPLLDSLDETRKDKDNKSTYITIDTIREKNIARLITKDLSGKDVAGLMSTEVPDPNDKNPDRDKRKKIKLLVHPEVMKHYSSGLLKRMVQEMAPEDIGSVRTEVDKYMEQYRDGKKMKPGVSKRIEKLAKWLDSADSADFS